MTDALFFDIETHSASDRFRMEPDEFFRVGGIVNRLDQYGETRDHATMVDELNLSAHHGETLVGHNVVSFDLPALGLDVLALASDKRVLDTMIVDAVVDPPESDLVPARAMRDKYSLDAACNRYGVAGKVGDLKGAATEHGGFGSIPTDDPGHLAYLRADVEATRALYHQVVRDVSDWDYVWREHRVHALMSNITTVGFDVDRDLLRERNSAGEARQRELVDWLVSEHGIPTTLPNGKAAKSPHATKAGKEALVAAFAKVGVSSSELPRTPKGDVSFSADGLAAVAERFPEDRKSVV